MTDITEQALRDHREQVEHTSDEPLSGQQRAKVLYPCDSPRRSSTS